MQLVTIAIIWQAIHLGMVAASSSVSDKMDWAKKLQDANPLLGGVTGYLSVGTQGQDMFYWMFPPKDGNTSAPIAFWLQGGPGSSSMYGLLFENGPNTLHNGTIYENPYAWNNNLTMIFVDNPVGTGFSHSSVDQMVQTGADIQQFAEDFVLAFLNKYPQFKGRDMYLTGESYGGHHIPYYANRLFQLGKSNPDINLKGVAIGNGWVAASQIYLSYPNYLLQEGMINQTQFDSMQPAASGCSFLMKYNPVAAQGQATNYCDYYWDLVVVNSTGEEYFDVYDIRRSTYPDESQVVDFLAMPETLNFVQASKFNALMNDDVYTQLVRLDWRVDTSPFLQPLLDAGLKVLAYNGNKDFICNYISGDYWTSNTTWTGQANFNKVTQYADLGWGKVKQYNNFAFAIIDQAGHMVPMDQPENAKLMLDWFINSFVSTS